MQESGKCKILLLGQSAVEKTCLFKRFTNQTQEKITPTIGLQYKQRVLQLRDGSTINAQLWDSDGTERYRTITPICYRNLDGVLIVFDITISNLIGIHNTCLTSEKKGEEKVILFGNKNDKQTQRDVNTQQAKQKARQHGIFYFQTSSLSAESTNFLFLILIEKSFKNEILKSRTK